MNFYLFVIHIFLLLGLFLSSLAFNFLDTQKLNIRQSQIEHWNTKM